MCDEKSEQRLSKLLMNRLEGEQYLFKMYVASFLLLLGINSALLAGMISILKEGCPSPSQSGVMEVIIASGFCTGVIYTLGVVPQYWITMKVRGQIRWTIKQLGWKLPLTSAWLLYTTTTGILAFSLLATALWIYIYSDLLL